MLKQSLQWRLVFMFILLNLVLMLTVAFFLWRSVEGYYYNLFQSGIEAGFDKWSLKDSTDLTAEKIHAEIKASGSLFQLVGNYKSYSVVDLQESKVAYSSDPHYSEAGERAFFNDITRSRNLIAVMEGSKTSGANNRLVTMSDGSYFDYARRVGNFVLYFRYDRLEWKPMLDRFNVIVINAMLLGVLAALVIGFLLSKTITAPVVRITQNAQRLAEGDFDAKLPVQTSDEIGKLSEAFNHMAGELQRTMTEIAGEKNKVEMVLNTMTDGVAAYNLQGDVIHANPAALGMLGPWVRTMPFNGFCVRLGLDMSVETLERLEHAGVYESDVSLGEGAFRLQMVLFYADGVPGGVLAVLADVTEQRRLEQMRRDFVANVSHELRTPLTSIKSYAETLLDGALDDRAMAEHFLSVINSESDRMTRLVKDLLQLSRIDNRQMNWQFGPQDLMTLTRTACERQRHTAETKEQVLECQMPAHVPPVWADGERVEQVMLNVISNAVKYTPEHGRVVVSLTAGEDHAVFQVTDNGIGIPEQDLPHIFERFYRVDKARSRDMGGTGLGLSIAREIVEAHGGKISIRSQRDEGTQVEVQLPYCPQEADSGALQHS